ncbi:hypothetical protein F1C10_15195 [Sphingomonas sp. NBWT7]|uniref:hypothetical protein n=1 Tax=Sphingomonas sp. NBWT7 TaxID=2596913 RepID=UPI0016256733|nr:hypothetical protein [Sphingomonas sp. NBWT7]QNE33129.1 hypothetical protein F1C10_15195 [Sphingomonas sp. NBWT7]
MTHTPPVPPGNQSPYPIQEPPHAADAAPAIPTTSAAKPTAPAIADDNAADEWAPSASPARWSLGTIVGAAAGVGAIAIGVAAILFPRDSAASPKPKPSAKRTPKSKPKPAK